MDGNAHNESCTEMVLVQSIVYAEHVQNYENSAIQKLEVATGMVDESAGISFDVFFSK